LVFRIVAFGYFNSFIRCATISSPTLSWSFMLPVDLC